MAQCLLKWRGAVVTAVLVLMLGVPVSEALHMMAGCPRCGHGLPKNTPARPSCSTEVPVG